MATSLRATGTCERCAQPGLSLAQQLEGVARFLPGNWNLAQVRERGLIGGLRLAQGRVSRRDVALLVEQVQARGVGLRQPGLSLAQPTLSLAHRLLAPGQSLLGLPHLLGRRALLSQAQRLARRFELSLHHLRPCLSRVLIGARRSPALNQQTLPLQLALSVAQLSLGEPDVGLGCRDLLRARAAPHFGQRRFQPVAVGLS